MEYARWIPGERGHPSIVLPVDGGFTELGVYRQVWRRATGKG